MDEEQVLRKGQETRHPHRYRGYLYRLAEHNISSHATVKKLALGTLL